ncbi:2'-5' RNA ligase family protein [Chitinophaga sp. 30R24]|uniref:2'-5' RNA ligase family protein n=1 Tax=Chitinophaga sp. 30R24 TaxID=3248838 RepID=UPI003B8F9A46
MSHNLIVTLQLDTETTAFLNRQRKKYYPAHANRVAAHLTLFYCLPVAAEQLITHTLLETVAAQPVFPVAISEVQLYGNWVAYTLQSDKVKTLHATLQLQWESWLSKRDQRPFYPHITVMNGSTAFKAQQTYQELERSFYHIAATVTGIQLWRYRKGPWEPVATYSFAE